MGLRPAVSAYRLLRSLALTLHALAFVWSRDSAFSAIPPQRIPL